MDSKLSFRTYCQLWFVACQAGFKLTIQIIMSAINRSPNESESFYNTPLKYHASSFSTNQSLAISSTFGKSKFRDTDQSRLGWRSNQILRDFPSADLTTIKYEDIQNNQSEVTLNPAFNPDEIQEIFQWKQIIAFSAKSLRDHKSIILLKQKAISNLKQEILFCEKSIRRQTQRYDKLKVKLQKKRIKDKNSERRRSLGINREITVMNQEIQKMKRTLSIKKCMESSSQGNEANTKRNRNDNRNKGRKNIIYVPIMYGTAYIPPGNSNHTLKSDTSPYQYIHTARHPDTTRFHRQYQPIIANTARYPHQNGSNGHIRPEQLSTQQPRSRRNSENQPVPTVFALLSQKLRTEPFPPIESNINEGIITSKDVANADLQIKSSKGNFNINVHAPQETHLIQAQGQKEDYFESNNFKQIQAEQIALIKRDKKDTSLQKIDPPSDGEEEVRKTLELIEESITKTIKPADNRFESPVREAQLIRSSAKKLDTNNICVPTLESPQMNEFDISLPERSRTKSNRGQNTSDVDISYESEQKKKSIGEDSTEKNNQKQYSPRINQSTINIILESLKSPSNSQKQDKSIISPNRTLSYLENQITCIQEVEDEQALSRQATPVDYPNSFGSFQKLQNSTGIAKQRLKQKAEEKTGDAQPIEESHAQTNKTPLLSNPPSLRELEEDQQIEHNEDFDYLSNINLSPQSRKIAKPVSKLSQQSKYKTPTPQENDEDDDIFGIHLVTESRISREKKSELRSSDKLEQFHQGYEQILARSEPQDAKRYSLQQKPEDGEQQDEIRNSTVSSIVRKGSAIQKVKQRSPVNTIKMSSYGSPTGRSSHIIAAIKEEEQEADNAENDNKKHKKHISSIK